MPRKFPEMPGKRESHWAHKFLRETKCLSIVRQTQNAPDLVSETWGIL